MGIALITVSAVARLGAALPYAQEQLRSLVEAQQLSIASYVASDIEQSIIDRRALIAYLAGALPSPLLEQPQGLAAWIQERQRLNPAFSDGIQVYRPDGRGLLAGDPAGMGRELPVVAESGWFQAALKTDIPVISKPQAHPLDGGPIVIMAAPVRDASKRVVAVLAGIVALNGPGLFSGREERPLGATGSYLLISPVDKVFVGSSESSVILKSTPPEGVNLIHDRAMAGYRGTGVAINSNGVEELVAIQSVPSTGWFVVARLPTAEAFGPVNVLRTLALEGSLIALIVVLFILFLLLPRILRPLTDASRAMREMANGTRELATLPVVRKDEVGSLVLGFNSLLERLHEKDAELNESKARMSFMAHHDSLTGLFNREMLEVRLQHALDRAERDGSRFALLFCDLDCFKPINDGHGHKVGDAVLVQVASRLREGCRRADTVARLGGDEFVILLSDLEDARRDATALAWRYLTAIREPYSVGGRIFTLGVSIGITLYQGGAISRSQLMAQADTAMYRAKRAGKNDICFFEDAPGELLFIGQADTAANA